MEHNDNEPIPMIDVDAPAGQAMELSVVQAPASLIPSVLNRIRQAHISMQPINQMDRLLAALKDPDWHVRATAVRTVGELGEQAPIESLMVALSDEDETVRATAVRVLGKLDKNVPIEQLVAALHDPAGSVREIAALTLAELGTQVPDESLADILYSKADMYVHEAAQSQLQQLHPPASSPPISATPLTTQKQNGRRLDEPAQLLLAKLTDLRRRWRRWIAVWQEEDDSMASTGVDERANSDSSLPQAVPVKPKHHLAVRIGEGVLTVLLIAGIALSWLVLVHWVHPSSSGTSSHLNPTPTQASTPTPVLGSPFSGHNVSLTVVDGVVYAGSVDNAVYALRAGAGSLLWRYKTQGSVDEPPRVVNGIVYASANINQGPGSVYALRANDGTPLWQFTRRGYLYPPTVVNGVAYIAAGDNTLYALQASNGAILWHVTIQGPSGSSPIVVNNVVYADAYVDQGSGSIYALRAGDGSLLWHFTTHGYIYQPVVTDGVVYLDTPDGITALHASDGNQFWHFSLPSTGFSPPVVLNGVAYTIAMKVSLAPAPTSTSSGGYLARTAFKEQTMPFKSGVASLYALQASDGIPLWQYTMNNGKDSWGTLFAISNGIVYTGANVDQGNNSIYALRASDGDLLWHYTTGDAPMSAVVTNGIIYVGSASLAVFALSTSNGTLLWRYTPIGQVFNTPILLDNILYVSAVNGIIYALQANTGSLLWYYQTDITNG